MSKSIYSRVRKNVKIFDNDENQYRKLEKAIKSEAKSKDDKILLYAEASSLSLSEEPALLFGFLSLGVAIVSMTKKCCDSNDLVKVSLILWIIAFGYLIFNYINNYFKEHIKSILRNKYNIK